MKLPLLRMLLSVMVAALLLPASALAASVPVNGTVAAGSLTLTTTAAPSFGVTLDGTDQTAAYTLPATVTDARGGNAGWNLTVTSTQFSTGGATPSTLPANASTITAVSNACVTGATCTNPTNAISYPVALPAGATAPPAVKYFNAAVGTGKGKFTNTPTIGVLVPANADAGSYTSTVTISAVSGP